jgi:hypothetical protein
VSDFTILDVDPLAPEIVIWYLDYDPQVAARCVPDALVGRALIQAAKVLSAVWATQAPEQVVSEWVPPTDQCAPYTPPEELRSLLTKLHGQRIYSPALHRPDVQACVRWAAASKANYDWLWRYGWHLAHVHSTCLGKPHGAMPVLWVLEWAPACLDAAAGATEAPVLVRTRALVAEDGEEYVDSVASHREYLVKHRSRMLQWTGREVPSWSGT